MSDNSNIQARQSSFKEGFAVVVTLRSVIEGIAIAFIIFLAMLLVFAFVRSAVLTDQVWDRALLARNMLWLHLVLGAFVGSLVAYLRLNFGRTIQYGVLPTVVLATVVCSAIVVRSMDPDETAVRCLIGAIYAFYAATVVALSKRRVEVLRAT